MCEAGRAVLGTGRRAGVGDAPGKDVLEVTATAARPDVVVVLTRATLNGKHSDSLPPLTTAADRFFFFSSTFSKQSARHSEHVLPPVYV